MGLPLLEFWELTPYEFRLTRDAYYEQEKRSKEDRVALAYMTALWTAQWFSKEQPKSLDEILGGKPVEKEMTDEQMYATVIALHKALGGE